MMQKERMVWVDQARGLAIFLVVYGHNFPFIEPYIYSFHVPLFFFISGFFHKDSLQFGLVKKRAKAILIPYFFWASLLFLFWWAFGRDYGNSSAQNSSVMDNFLGIFYAQGGQDYMDWGIPLWFLPCIFLVFLFYGILRKLLKGMWLYVFLMGTVAVGFLWSSYVGLPLPWSIDVAMVAVSFYGLGNLFKNFFFRVSGTTLYLCFILALFINITAFYFNTTKVDMYRSIYGNEGLFLISGLSGAIAYTLFFKAIPVFKPLEYIGKHTIVILATHLRAMTVIKAVLFIVLGRTVFHFTEWEKFYLAIVQILLLIPFIWLIHKYIPLLDGKISRN